MQTFIVSENISGVLISLSELIERMHLGDVATWRFRNISLNGAGRPFGMTFDEFEAASRAFPIGFEVPDSEFRTFLRSDFQIVDGEIEAWSDQIPAGCIAHLDCEDTSQWAITTDLPELARRLEFIGRAENVSGTE